MNTQPSERVTLLQQIFENINNWLHFAEAKNVALIAFNISFIAAILGADFAKFNIYLFAFIIIGLSGSTFATLWSFKPINSKLGKPHIKNIESNLLHFAYIASLEQSEYIKEMYSLYWGEQNKDINSVPQLEKDYCEEIIENSRIALRKQKFFRIGFYIDVLMIIMFVLLVVCA